MNKPIILFEGGDGVGKSTQVELATEFLKNTGIEVLVTKEPGSPHLASNMQLRQIVKTDASLSAMERELLFMADAERHKRFLEAKRGEQTVVCDRGYYSHLVYQKASQLKGLLTEKDLGLLKIMVNRHVVKPDHTFIFNADFEVAKSRMANRGGMDVIEALGEDFLRFVNQEYKNIKKGHKVHLIDANKSVEEVSAQVKGVLSKIIRQSQ